MSPSPSSLTIQMSAAAVQDAAGDADCRKSRSLNSAIVLGGCTILAAAVATAALVARHRRRCRQLLEASSEHCIECNDKDSRKPAVGSTNAMDGPPDTGTPEHKPETTTPAPQPRAVKARAAAKLKEEDMIDLENVASGCGTKGHEDGGGGCGRGQGPLAEWQKKIHIASLAVNETKLALRGGSMSLKNELRQISEDLAMTESTLQDAAYCTGREAQIEWLMKELEPLQGTDASTQLLHPTKGEALCEKLRLALSSWDP